MLGFLIIAVAALITTCHIAVQRLVCCSASCCSKWFLNVLTFFCRHTHLNYAVRNGMFDKEVSQVLLLVR